MAGAVSNPSYAPERLEHLGIVAGVCREIGLAEWLDAQDKRTHERVSMGAATVAMILNGLGLGFSNRRLYLMPQFCATKPVECLLGRGITAEDLSDDCLGRALDWLYAHDPTTLFAGIALRARLAATGQTIPDQVKKPTNRPTMRWVFQCFEGIELLHIRHGLGAVTSLILRLAPLHQSAAPRPAGSDLRGILRIE